MDFSKYIDVGVSVLWRRRGTCAAHPLSDRNPVRQWRFGSGTGRDGARTFPVVARSGVLRRRALIALLIALTGCGARDPAFDPGTGTPERQVPSNLTPGVHFSGDLRVGVVKRF